MRTFFRIDMNNTLKNLQNDHPFVLIIWKILREDKICKALADFKHEHVRMYFNKIQNKISNTN